MAYWLSLDLRSIGKTKLFSSRRFRWVPIEVELRSPERKRERPVRPADLVKGLSSPFLCAPAWRPAHLLGYLASPRLGLLPRHLLGTCLAPASGYHWLADRLALPVYPSCMHWCWCACSGHLLLGAPTQQVKRRRRALYALPRTPPWWWVLGAGCGAYDCDCVWVCASNKARRCCSCMCHAAAAACAAVAAFGGGVWCCYHRRLWC
jgi:hypothetical protein